MKAVHIRRLILATVLGLSLAVVLGVVAFVSSAQVIPPALAITGTTLFGPCPVLFGSPSVLAVQQNNPTAIGFNVSGFQAGEPVEISFRLPDGRVRSLRETIAADGALNVRNTAIPQPLVADNGGALFFNYNVGNAWPTGCYLITAVGQISQITTPPVPLLITSGTISVCTLVPPASLAVGTLAPPYAAAGAPDAAVTINGTGFLAGEPITIDVIQPDGTTAPFFGTPTTSASGDFSFAFLFNASRQIGLYTFRATGATSGCEATGTYTLLAPGIGTITPPALTTITSVDPVNPNLLRVEVQGEQFTSGENITFEMREAAPPPTPGLPGTLGRLYSLAPTTADAGGKFAIVFYLDQSFPSSTYTVIAAGGTSGVRRSGTFTLVRP